MAKNADTVREFLMSLSTKLTPLMEKDLKYWLELKKEVKASRGESFDGVIHPYDYRFYNDLSVRKQFNVDEEKLRPYFPLDVAFTGCLAIYELLLGFKFERVTDLPPHSVWHPDVKVYRVIENTENRKGGKKKGEVVGYFHLDMHVGPIRHYSLFA
jgi:Zn-dependent oligopeptidase